MEKQPEMNKNKIALFGTIAFLTTMILMIIFLPMIAPQDVAPVSDGNEVTNIDVETAYSMINNITGFPNLLILDVRDQSEYDAGHINNSVLIPDGDLESRLDELEEYKDSEIIVHCRSGSRSRTASTILATNGFSKVYNMLGGFNAWTAAGYPTE